MTAAHRKTCSVGFALIFGGACLWATQFAAFADEPPSDAGPPADAAGKNHVDTGQIETASREADPSRTIHLYGTVFGPDRCPLAGARLYLNVDERTDPIELGMSSDDGAYHFEVSDRQLRRIVAPSFMLLKQKASLIAVAEGFGADWSELPSVTGARLGEMHHQYERDFHLVADLPIAGRVVDVEGKPVAGAVVAVSRICELSDPDWYKMHRAIRSNDPHLMSRKEVDPTGWFTPLYRTAWKVIPPAMTDADGRFRIAGVGCDRAINLRVVGPGIRNTEVSVLTRNDAAGFTRAVRAKHPRTPDLDGYFYPPRKDESKGDRGVSLFGPSPTIQVDPARTISGVVRDAETGKPLADVQVRVHAIVSPASATTDRQGRYRIQRSEDKPSILVYTRSDPARYLDVVHRVTDAKGLGGEIDADLELPRGVAVAGRVLEAGTDRPIVSAPDGSCHVQWPGPLQTGYVRYFPLASNAALRGSPTGLYFQGIQPGTANYYTSVPIDPDGGFRIAVPPGPGILLVRSSPGMPFNAELIARWKENQGFHRLFPYVALEYASCGWRRSGRLMVSAYRHARS